MLVTHTYRREQAVVYAETWAFGRNPAYYNYDGLGGDCTNFVSQCLYAGCGVMNPTPLYGWYYWSANDKTPSWTGVPYLHNFLVRNQGPGPFGHLAQLQDLLPGDIIQLSDGAAHFYHTLLVVQSDGSLPGTFVASHTMDSFLRPLSTYSFGGYRCIHLDGYRQYE